MLPQKCYRPVTRTGTHIVCKFNSTFSCFTQCSVIKRVLLYLQSSSYCVCTFLLHRYDAVFCSRAFIVTHAVTACHFPSMSYSTIHFPSTSYSTIHFPSTSYSTIYFPSMSYSTIYFPYDTFELCRPFAMVCLVRG